MLFLCINTKLWYFVCKKIHIYKHNTANTLHVYTSSIINIHVVPAAYLIIRLVVSNIMESIVCHLSHQHSLTFPHLVIIRPV